jgi:hypothetical protein
MCPHLFSRETARRQCSAAMSGQVAGAARLRMDQSQNVELLSGGHDYLSHKPKSNMFEVTLPSDGTEPQQAFSDRRLWAA